MTTQQLVDTCYGFTGGDLYVCSACGSRTVVRSEAACPPCPCGSPERIRERLAQLDTMRSLLQRVLLALDERNAAALRAEIEAVLR